MKKYPIVLFIFKRPDTTEKVLKEIICSNPPKIYIFADQGRNKQEIEEVRKTRDLVDAMLNQTNIIVFRNYSIKNKGLKNSIIEGLNTVFKLEKAAIILEDDCLPNQDFFRFTNELLTKHAGSKTILSISGTSFDEYKFKSSYDFSIHPQCWGWGTWRRAWKLYDPKLSEWLGLFNNETIKNTKLDGIGLWYWTNIFNLVKSGYISTWDYQWHFTHWKVGGLAITPSINLVKNIGFDRRATNTSISRGRQSSLSEIKFPLIHPEKITNDETLDSIIEKKSYISVIPILGLILKLVKIKLGIL